MSSLDIKVEGFDLTDDFLEALPENLNRALDKSVREIAQDIYRESQQRVPVKKGSLKKSGKVRHAPRRSTVTYDAPHAELVHDGIKADRITARRAKMLRFEWEDAPPGVAAMFPRTFPIVFFKSIKVSALMKRGRPFLDEAARATLARVNAIIARNIVDELG